jgi:7-cyano-7-deazaguanine tRNA-ribosyltransferase
LEIVAGLSLKNLKPRVWDPTSSYYLSNLQAVMVSYADFHQMPVRRRKAMEQGLHTSLAVPETVKVYLDNGAFYFLSRDGEIPRKDYEQFVAEARPDWWPIPQDFIPTPKMTQEQQRDCLRRTMAMNRAYHQDGYVPVIHISRFLKEYFVEIKTHDRLSQKPDIALGGIVPNLLRAPKAMPYTEVLDSLQQVKREFAGKQIHIFGIGGTATLHLAALLGVDSVDSSGWRNRAARGIVQLPGSGDRVVAELGNWRGRRPSPEEWDRLAECQCPACQQHGLDGLKAKGIQGFCNRATHNLWTLLEEARLIEKHLAAGTYNEWYTEHVENSTYLPLIEQALALRNRLS